MCGAAVILSDMWRPKITIRALAPFFILGVLGIATWVIVLELRSHSISEIAHAITAIPTDQLLAGIVLVIPALIAIACYDLVAIHALSIPVAWWRVVGTGLLSYSITNTTGHAIIVGELVRLRLYPRWGVSVIGTTQIVAFSVITYYVGLTTTASFALLLEGGELKIVLNQIPHLGPALASRWFRTALPIVLLIGIASWFLLLVFKRGPLHVAKKTFHLPSFRVGLLQLLVSCADIFIAASALYVLLPTHKGISWLAFVGIFSIVQFAALISAVPGGIGVFAGLMMIILRPTGADPAVLFASLLAFRALYGLIPFAIGGVVFLCFLRQKPAIEVPAPDITA